MMDTRFTIVVCMFVTEILLTVLGETMWAEWWSYQGISGPDYWGVSNPEYALCRIGMYQSPINIEPKSLIYDPNLKILQLEPCRVDGKLYNTGQDITYEISDMDFRHLNFTGGPLSYHYRANKLKIHFGLKDHHGSEHTVDGKSFAAEVQLLGYNSDLYKNFTEAKYAPHGIAGIAMLAAIGQTPNDRFDRIIQASKRLRVKGSSIDIYDFDLMSIIPTTEFFITYEGSITYPGCYETVTWLVVNKPLYITKEQLAVLRDLTHVDEPARDVLMGNNFRLPKSVNRRLVRTNITPKSEDEACNIKKLISYRMNERFIQV
ncbi:hypothetical protein ScPMuIL_010541 [Solemya velum]